MDLVTCKNNLKKTCLKLKLLNLTCLLISDNISINELIRCTYVLKLKKFSVINEELLLF